MKQPVTVEMVTGCGWALLWLLGELRPGLLDEQLRLVDTKRRELLAELHRGHDVSVRAADDVERAFRGVEVLGPAHDQRGNRGTTLRELQRPVFFGQLDELRDAGCQIAYLDLHGSSILEIVYII